MIEDRTGTEGQDRSRIRLEGDEDVRDWARMFGVTELALRRAVERVGDDTRAVQRELGGRR
jgi:hypothetical protein